MKKFAVVRDILALHREVAESLPKIGFYVRQKIKVDFAKDKSGLNL